METPIGYVPDPKDINLEGLEGEVTIDSLKSMLDVDKRFGTMRRKVLPNSMQNLATRFRQSFRRSLLT